MSSKSRLAKSGAAALLALALSAAGLASAGPAAANDPTPQPTPMPPAKGAVTEPVKPEQGSRLSSHSRGLLATAEASGRKAVAVMALTAPGKTAGVADELRGLGATVGYRHDKVGYVRASVPTGQVRAAAKLAGVQAMDLDETLSVPDPQVEPAGRPASGSRPWTGPNARTAPVNPYLPTHETGAVAFTGAHPEADGRGVTIGVLDSGVDLDHPALAKTSTGERKIVDWVTATDPLLEGDGSWRPMVARVTAPRARYGGATWTLPTRPGADYALNVFRESAAAGSEEYAGDVNRDGDTTDAWGVLYDYTTNDIWVDLDQDHDFTDETPMRPYGEKFQVGHFGTDSKKTPVVESVPFVVEFRRDVDLTPAGLAGQTADFVNIGTVADSHGTHVAGIAAGHNLFGGVDGAAPGARIVSSKACLYAGGCTAVALSEGMIDLVANRKVDVVNMSIGGLPALNDGANVRAQLYNRLIDTYGVQLFISAGNSGPGVNTVGDPAVASDAVAVAATAGRDTWKSNYGADVSAPMMVQNYSSRGPREDGGVKPDLAAPGSAISTVPRWSVQKDLPTVSYRLPPGYAMFNGTSMASPQATGAAALLLSAARQADLPVLPRQLRESLYSTARPVSGAAATAQGSGLMDVVGAWEALRRSPDVSSRYTISAPVCTPISDMLATPNRGAGLYNRCAPGAGGPRSGVERTDDVTITRTAGPAEAVEHRLTWVGGDGTFGAPDTVALPLGEPVTVPITSRPRGTGAHTAMLQLDSPATPLVDARMSAAVVVADPVTDSPFEQTTSGSVERVRTTSYFVDVPKGARALQVNLSGIAAGSQARWVAINPYGVPVDEPTSKVTCYTNDSSDAKACNPVSRSYSDPLPGVWELQVEAKRTTPTLRNPFTLTAAAQGVRVTPEEQRVTDPRVGVPAPVSWTVDNRFGDVVARGVGGPLGSARTARPTIRSGERQQYEIEVPQGAAALQASIGSAADLTADLDLYVYDSAGAVVGMSADGDSDEEVTIPSPEPGTYTVEVEAYQTGSSGTAYDYLDMFTSPTLGSLTVDPAPLTLAERESGRITGVVTVRSAAATGRVLVGDMHVTSDEGAVLGRGRVLIGDGDAGSTAPPTGSPTASPTGSPTGSPTPTAPPSGPAPTDGPTGTPTGSPTIVRQAP